MATAREFINSAMRKIQVLGAGSVLTNKEAQNALEGMNDMIASWSTQGALIYTEEKETFTLTSALSYTIGSGGDINTTTPKKITSAYVTYAGCDYPLQIIDSKEYSCIADKDCVGVPTQLYFNGDYPLGKIYVWPIQSGATVTIFSEKPLTEFTDLDTVFAMPSEYRRAIKNNLAVEMAPEYEAEAPPTIKRIAKQSLDWVRAQNRKNDKGVIKVDSAFLTQRRYDINRGY